ncbi:hypothetical protein M23134_03162 [Microscilla marina ATCC 23134]|uniref:Lipoprotein n=2 Tax=Microscilla marina TaxID=1027 RepID=A1ZGA9_MICM2|nr:hypothetical protein M23134_03162 [Microscilla marina ATCC 23134]
MFKYLLVFVCAAFICVSCNTTEEVKPEAQTSTISKINQRSTCRLIPSSMLPQNITTGQIVTPSVTGNGSNTILKTFTYTVTNPRNASRVWLHVKDFVDWCGAIDNNDSSPYTTLVIKDANGNELYNQSCEVARYVKVPGNKFTVTLKVHCALTITPEANIEVTNL